MAAIQEGNVARNGTFVQRVMMVLLKEAAALVQVPGASPLTAQQIQRHNFAVQLYRTPAPVAERVALVIAPDLAPAADDEATIAGITDAAIRTAIQGKLQALTGVLIKPDGSAQDVTVLP